VKLGRDTQMRSTRTKRGRRVLGLALVLLLAFGLIAPYLHVHSARGDGAPRAHIAAASHAVTSVVQSVRGGHGLGMPPGPGGPHQALGHNDLVLAQTDDTPSLESFAAALTDALPTAGAMLAVGFVVGTLTAFVQAFMSRASRTRGQPSVV
jgi:hypothetical protein